MKQDATELTGPERFKVLTSLYRSIDTVRMIDANLPTQTFAALLSIAMKEGQSVKEVAEAIGIAQSSASRNISMLSNWDWKKKAGLCLVEYRQDPQNLTVKNIYLTVKGKRVIDQILHILYR